VDEIAGLGFIPPADRLNLKAVGRQRGQGLLDLDGLAPVREGERQRTIDQNFHAFSRDGLNGKTNARQGIGNFCEGRARR